ncbi:MAG TPA: septal ring lytic transglycosylase RlpA family protein [Acidobacteriaceae bacterium]|nr:septal ring lytic transglycosylase RlpA family protein [Acidobacteriaceae bacterium]
MVSTARNVFGNPCEGRAVSSRLSRFCLALLGLALLPATGCHHRSSAQLPPAPPPAIAEPSAPSPTTAPTAPGAPEAAAVADSPEDAEFVRTHSPISTEEGLASWYGPPYDQRRSADGKVYNQYALTAAHRTLPLNSLIEVTNVSTGQSAIMRVTDRGPFVPGRALDLSLASAKAVGVWRPGVAMVRIDVYAAPSAINEGGRWCVQIGAFKSRDGALDLRDHLMRKYERASVIEFAGPTGYWVRIRPENDDRSRAVEIENSLRPSEGAAYLVRLD